MTKKRTSPGGKPVPAGTTDAVYERMAFYSYGVWLCKDDRAVLVNRYREPIWYRIFVNDGTGAGIITDLADPKEICAAAERHWIYDDTGTETQKQAKAAREMATWGLVLSSTPYSEGEMVVGLGPWEYRLPSSRWLSARRTCTVERAHDQRLGYPWHRPKQRA